jgi:hypothetical protein
MEFKLFGKNLFEIKKSNGGYIYNSAIEQLKKSDFLIDFYRDLGGNSFDSNSYITQIPDGGAVGNMDVGLTSKKNIKKETKKEDKPQISPKEVYEAKMLNESSFSIKVDPEYIDEQLKSFKDKFEMVRKEEYDMNRGVIEIQSIVTRLENRKKYGKFCNFYDEFPYTSSSKIGELIKKHNHLSMGQIAQFVADMPKEATNIMKSYTSKTKELCGKKPVFYIIANKKDFEKTNKRRDPILLAQSPFGHFWQILGAWDKEMLLIEEL